MAYKRQILCMNEYTNRGQIVDKDSARLGLPNENAVGVIAANHVTICKFHSRDSRRYRPVWQAIQALFEKKEEKAASSMSN